MGLVICIKKRNHVKIYSFGDTVSSLVMGVAICRAISQKISCEKNITLNDAIKIFVEAVEETKSQNFSERR